MKLLDRKSKYVSETSRYHRSIVDNGEEIEPVDLDSILHSSFTNLSHDSFDFEVTSPRRSLLSSKSKLMKPHKTMRNEAFDSMNESIRKLDALLAKNKDQMSSPTKPTSLPSTYATTYSKSPPTRTSSASQAIPMTPSTPRSRLPERSFSANAASDLVIPPLSPRKSPRRRQRRASVDFARS